MLRGGDNTDVCVSPPLFDSEARASPQSTVTMDHHYPQHQGLLYHPASEHDACGVGFVADIGGHRSHEIVEKAITAVVRLTHRGAVSADGKSGDGAGILTQVPDAFFARELARLGLPEVPPGDLAVGMIFLPGHSKERLETCVKLLEASVEAQELCLAGWRSVPVDQDALGEKARATCPEIRQLFVARPPQVDPDEFERRLYLCRRQAERAAAREGLGDFYIPSFSS